MQKQQTSSEKVNTPPDGFIVGTDLQKEKGAPAGGGVGAETEDDEEGATQAQSDAEGSDDQ